MPSTARPDRLDSASGKQVAKHPGWEDEGDLSISDVVTFLDLVQGQWVLLAISRQV